MNSFLIFSILSLVYSQYKYTLLVHILVTRCTKSDKEHCSLFFLLWKAVLPYKKLHHPPPPFLPPTFRCLFKLQNRARIECLIRPVVLSSEHASPHTRSAKKKTFNDYSKSPLRQIDMYFSTSCWKFLLFKFQTWIWNSVNELPFGIKNALTKKKK